MTIIHRHIRLTATLVINLSLWVTPPGRDARVVRPLITR